MRSWGRGVGADVVAAVAVVGMFWALPTAQAAAWPYVAVGVVLAAVTAGAMVLRGRLPFAATVTAGAATVVGGALGVCQDPMLAAAWCLYPLAVERARRTRVAVVMLAAMFAALALVVAVPEGAARGLGERVVIAVAALSASWLFGTTTGRQIESARETERMRVQLEVARDVHDVVGHALGVTLAQSGVVLSLPDVGEAELRETLAEVETHTRRALEDVQALVRTLRDPDGGPGPGLDGIAAVITATRAAGIDVETRISRELGLGIGAGPNRGPTREGGTETGGKLGAGPTREGGTEGDAGLGPGIGPETTGKVGDGVGAVAFRVVQEALGNVVRHAPGAKCVVDVHRERDALVVRVADGGALAGRDAARSAGAGVGLRGMRERVRLAGGTVTWGVRPEGGFAVEARLPLNDQGQATTQRRNQAGVQGQSQNGVQERGEDDVQGQSRTGAPGQSQAMAQEQDRVSAQGRSQAAVRGRDEDGVQRQSQAGVQGRGFEGGDDVR
ncbi:histidine kinase [Streptosporangium sp. NPDC020145]|uniref:sensor histidine kinase n=1 Tax=Streptosporangium sp. NPDC020145 TaxID=3154694 RepID=UPI003449EB11